jgi:hypothetical protein
MQRITCGVVLISVHPAIFQKMDTSMGLSSIASLSLGLSMSMTGTPGGAMMMRNLGVGVGASGPFSRGMHGHSAAAHRLGLPTLRNNYVLHSPNSRRHGGGNHSGQATPNSGDKSATPEVVHKTVAAETNTSVRDGRNDLAKSSTHQQSNECAGDHVRVELVGRQERCPTFDGPDVIIIHDSRIPTASRLPEVEPPLPPLPTVSDRIPVVVSDSLVPASGIVPPPPQPQLPSQQPQQQLELVLGPQRVLLTTPSPPTISVCSPTSAGSSDEDVDDDEGSDENDVLSCSSSGESLSRVLSGTQLSVDPRSYYVHNGGPVQRPRQGQRRCDGGYMMSSSSSYLDRRSKRLMRRCFGGRTWKGVWGINGNGRAASMSERPLTEQDQNASWDKVCQHFPWQTARCTAELTRWEAEKNC